MTKLDLNRVVAIIALLALVVIAAMSGYRLEIGPNGLKFERPLATTSMARTS